MMNDIYLEYILKKKKTGGQKGDYRSYNFCGDYCIAGFAITYFCNGYCTFGHSIRSFSFSIGLVLIAFAWYGAVFAYEYAKY